MKLKNSEKKKKHSQPGEGKQSSKSDFDPHNEVKLELFGTNYIREIFYRDVGGDSKSDFFEVKKNQRQS